MKTFALTLALLLSATAAFAQSPPLAEQAPNTQKSKAFHPSFKELIPALTSSGLQKVSTSVSLAYDQSGNVYAVKLDKPTGDKDLDKAILSWAAKVKMSTDKPGIDSVPITMTLGD